MSFQIWPLLGHRCSVHQWAKGASALVTEVCKSALPSVLSNRGQHHKEQGRVKLVEHWEGGQEKSEGGH